MGLKLQPICGLFFRITGTRKCVDWWCRFSSVMKAVMPWLVYRLGYIPTVVKAYNYRRCIYGANMASEQVAAITAILGFVILGVSAIICYIR